MELEIVEVTIGRAYNSFFFRARQLKTRPQAFASATTRASSCVPSANLAGGGKVFNGHY